MFLFVWFPLFLSFFIHPCGVSVVFVETRSQRSPLLIVFVIEASLWLPYTDRWSLFVSVDCISYFFPSLSICLRTTERWSYDFCVWYLVYVCCQCHRRRLRREFVRIYNAHIVNALICNIYFNGILELHLTDFCQCGAPSNHISTETQSRWVSSRLLFWAPWYLVDPISIWFRTNCHFETQSAHWTRHTALHWNENTEEITIWMAVMGGQPHLHPHMIKFSLAPNDKK